MTDCGTTVTVGGVVYRIGYVFVAAEPTWEWVPRAERRWWTEGVVACREQVDGDAEGESTC